MIPIDKFTAAYAAHITLKDHPRKGLEALLTAINNDANVTDIRWIAYMLATVKHECAGTWHPIEEYGHGKGRVYGVPDPTTGKVYYGRGFVQLTWKNNYRAMGKVFGIDLVARPELALDPDIAYRIMSYGMRNGSFTGVGLKRYIDQEKCDYIGARKIINGTDQAQRIAGYATEIETILRACQQ